MTNCDSIMLIAFYKMILFDNVEHWKTLVEMADIQFTIKEYRILRISGNPVLPFSTFCIMFCFY